ncbi:MAG: LysR substrate-binding domain-containing protein [Protaetiibacter sp.]
MTLAQLRSFIVVAEELNFRRAAERLYVTQPPLTRQIQALERAVGVELFLRADRRISLTPAGEVFLRDAEAILAHIDRARARAIELGVNDLRQVLRVGYLEPIAVDLVQPVLARFRKKHGGADVELHEVGSFDAVRQLLAGELDLAFVRPPIQSTAIKLTFLRKEQLIAALPEAHPLAGKTIWLSQLRSESFVAFSLKLGSGIYNAILSCCANAGFVPDIVQLCSSIPMLLNMVAGGEGVTLLTYQYASTPRPGIAYAKLRDPGSTVALALASAREGESALSEDFRDICIRTVNQVA